MRKEKRGEEKRSEAKRKGRERVETRGRGQGGDKKEKKSHVDYCYYTFTR